MHASRWRVLRDVVLCAVCGRALALSSLALGTVRATGLRHRVKCVDRLLVNAHLESERVDAYRALAHEWLSGLPQLLIVVDWSSLTADLQWHWLRASVVVDGRSITLYEEVHARAASGRAEGSPAVHRAARRLAAGKRASADHPHRCGLSHPLVSLDWKPRLDLDRAHAQSRLRAPARRRMV
jgi:hypothetical protein